MIMRYDGVGEGLSAHGLLLSIRNESNSYFSLSIPVYESLR
jgi:hypothetical protein